MHKAFEPYGKVLECVVLRDPITSRSRCCGFVTFESVSVSFGFYFEQNHFVFFSAVGERGCCIARHGTKVVADFAWVIERETA